MDQYQKMWEDWSKPKSARYLNYKFLPNHRVGLTNYLRERMIHQFLDIQPTDTILDAGCASGRQLFEIAGKIKAGYGTDIAENFVSQANQYKAQQGIDNLFFTQETVEHLSFADNFFDKVFCAEVLEHVDDKDVALRELLRVLKPGGTIVITVPNMNADATLWGRFLRLIGVRKFVPFTEFSKVGLDLHGDAHVREFTRHTLRAWLTEHHITVQNLKTISFLDGPYGDFILKFPLHVPLLRQIIIAFEMVLTKSGLPFGRHLIIKGIK